MIIQTKFDYGDDCWIMNCNRPMKARVFEIQFSNITRLNAGCSRISNVFYIVRVYDTIGGFDHKEIKLPEDYLFKTKNECIDSLR